MWFKRLFASGFNNLTLDELRKQLLFHGTIEPIKDKLTTRSHGDILWVAESPSVAQNYIPVSGVTTYFTKPYWPEDIFFPRNDFDISLIEQIIGKDNIRIERKNPKSYAIESISYTPGKKITGQDVINYLENTLKYKTSDRNNNTYELKTKYENGKQIVLPADYKAKGRLYLLLGKEKLNIFDLTEQTESDLMNPQYNMTGIFKKLQTIGYDGVRIHDFAQSKNWGNLGHISIGIFPSGLEKLEQHFIEATNFDWGDDLKQTDTEEYQKWLKERENEQKIL